MVSQGDSTSAENNLVHVPLHDHQLQPESQHLSDNNCLVEMSTRLSSVLQPFQWPPVSV